MSTKKTKQVKKKEKWKIIEDSGVFIVREIDSGYGWKHRQYQCPVCNTWHYKTAKYIHITSKAKKESLDKSAGLIMETPHLDFYLRNTEIVETRVWKGENRIK